MDKVATNRVVATLLLILAPCFGAVAAGQAERGTVAVRNESMLGNAMFGVPDKVYSREEIQSARPIEWLPAESADSRYQANKAFREQQPKVTGPFTSTRPGLPNPNADRDAMRDFAEDWELLRQEGENSERSSEPAGQFMQGEDLVDFGTADVYTSYRGNYWTTQQLQFPWKVVGKLLIDGGGYCTAQSITGAPKNIIVTAAHCVFNRATGQFYSGWTFVPAERNGAQPYGQFRWASARVLADYVSIGGRQHDVALIRLQNNAVELPVSYYTGWLGWRQDYPYVASLHSVGYASNISTQWTSICAAESFYASCEGANVLVKGCNMTFGSSGGAWIEQYKPYEVAGYVEGVVSGPSCAGAFGQTFVGPRFSSSNFGALCTAEGGCTTP